MSNFKKVLNFRFIPLTAVTFFIFTNTLYSCPDSSLRPPIGKKSTYRDIIAVASKDNGVLASNHNGMDRRRFLVNAAIGGVADAAFGRGFLSIPNLQAADNKRNLNISEEGIISRVISVLQALERTIVQGTVVDVDRLVKDLNKPQLWEILCPDYGKVDIGRAIRVYATKYSRYGKTYDKADKKLRDIANAVKDEYQALIMARSQGVTEKNGFKFSIIEKKKYPSSDKEIWVVEPLEALIPAPSAAYGDFQKIIIVRTEIMRFIDEIVIPAVYGKDILKWAHAILAGDPRVCTVLGEVIRNTFKDMDRSTIESILEGLFIRHEEKHNNGLIDLSKIKPEIEAMLRTREADHNSKMVDGAVLNIAEEFSPLIDGLEGDYPQVTFVLFINTINSAWTYNFYDPLTYSTLSFIFSKLCGVDLLEFIYAQNDEIKSGQVEKLRNFIINFLSKKDITQIKKELNNFARNMRAIYTFSKQTSVRLQRTAHYGCAVCL